MNNPLIKKPIIDKNGVATTRNVRADEGQDSKGAQRIAGVKPTIGGYEQTPMVRASRIAQQAGYITQTPLGAFMSNSGKISPYAFPMAQSPNARTKAEGGDLRDEVINNTIELLEDEFPHVLAAWRDDNGVRPHAEWDARTRAALDLLKAANKFELTTAKRDATVSEVADAIGGFSQAANDLVYKI